MVHYAWISFLRGFVEPEQRGVNWTLSSTPRPGSEQR